jgi:hypothetical protein
MRNLILATLLIFSCSFSWSAIFRESDKEVALRILQKSYNRNMSPRGTETLWYYAPEGSGESRFCKGPPDENNVLNLGDGIALSCSLQKSGEGQSDYAKSSPEIYQQYLLLDLDRCLFRVTDSVWGIQSYGAHDLRVSDSEVRGFLDLSGSREGGWFSDKEAVAWFIDFTIDRLQLTILETEETARFRKNSREVYIYGSRNNMAVYETQVKYKQPKKVIGSGVCKMLSDEEVKRKKEEKRRRVEAMEKAAEKTADIEEKAAEKTADIERKRLEAIKQERKF